tara:strand:- start:14636 stop:15001 length:366 start_codon:yes stop_codon:yes gene_type:complete
MKTTVNRVDKKVKLPKESIIQYQILTFCFLHDLMISVADLKCLTELAKTGKTELTDFCKLVTHLNIFKSPQSARNAITKYEKKGIVVKNGNNKKTVTLSSDMKVQTEGVVLLDYKFLGVES